MIPIALTIAGSDPSGGAGIQADLKTFHQFGVYGMSVITLLTVQNTCRVSAVETVAPQLVLDQLDAVLEDLPPQAAKTGALGNSEIIQAVAGQAKRFSFPLVVDPVMISKHGAPLLPEEGRDALARELLPHAYLVTPNVPEAMALAGKEFRGDEIPRGALEEAARAIAGMGAKAVLITGGHLAPDATDLLLLDGRFEAYPGKRIETRHTHGTGCTYSAAITAELAKGTELTAAIAAAKRFIARAIESNPGLGHGFGPVNHFTPA